MKNDSNLIEKMTAYFKGDAKRIQHFIKVYTFATLIGEGERLSAEQMYILRTAAIIHDIGIKNAEAKFGKCDGKLQEQEGEAEAEKMLTKLGYDSETVKKVCYLVAHHHTYTNIKDIELRILVEADFIVNAYEDDIPNEKVIFARYNIFRTATGKNLLNNIYALQ